jgi:hypothetical protein
MRLWLDFFVFRAFFFFAFSCFRVGLPGLPLCGAAPTFLCSGKEK